ncbi:MAG TPA: glycosyltransferase family 4 protein, partial [Saprospiraceae bacterium]|nr:glycosyltransferase family 4 protein [Saprospiraceae bacterium]
RQWLQGQLAPDPPHVLHAHFGPTGCHYLPLAQRLNRPLVVTFYGFDYTKLPRQRPIFWEKYRHLFRRAARVVSASEEGCDLLQRMGCPAEKLVLLRPSPRMEHFPWVARHKPAGRLRLLQVASFTPKKGHLTTLEAFRLALPHCPGLHLTLAGERLHADTFRQVQQFRQQHGLEQQVSVLDFVDHRRMAELMAGFDAFIHPSCQAPDGDHEANPVVLLEAQATGMPVLATCHFDLPREVLHEHTGLLADERDAPTLAAYICRMYAMESAEYERFSRQARQHVERHFDVDMTAQTLAKVYRELGNC